MRRASVAVADPTIQKAILIPSIVALTPDGMLVLKGNSTIWHVRRDVTIPTVLRKTDDDTVQIQFTQSDSLRNRSILSWNYPFSVLYHQWMNLDVKVSKGCSLQVETVIDGQAERRQLQENGGRVYTGTEEWTTLGIPVQGKELQYIYLLLDLDPTTEYLNQTSCTLELRSLYFMFSSY
jgi:hypothetical protein